METIAQAAQKYAAEEHETRSEYVAFVAGAEWMHEQMKGLLQWIPIEKKPPENDKPVLVRTGKGRYDVRIPIYDFGKYRFNNDVTHWRHIKIKNL
jgi:hypothetical protein